MPYCHRCGAEIEGVASYCSHCGADQDEGDISPARPAVGERHAALAGRTWTNALIGGTTGFLVAVFVAATFVPMYVIGIMGGAALAGFLQQRGETAGAKVGLLSGLIATAPVLLLIVLAAVIGVTSLFAGFVGQMSPWDGVAGFTAIAMLSVVASVLSIVANLVFGALGGFVGGALAGQ